MGGRLTRREAGCEDASAVTIQSGVKAPHDKAFGACSRSLRLSGSRERCYVVPTVAFSAAPAYSRLRRVITVPGMSAGQTASHS